MPGMWVLSFFTCVSEGVSSPIPTTTPPLVLIIAVSFNLLRFHEEGRQRQHLSPATAALSSSEGSVLSRGGGEWHSATLTVAQLGTRLWLSAL